MSVWCPVCAILLTRVCVLCVAVWCVCLGCVSAWQGGESGSVLPAQPCSHCCAHTHSVPWLQAVEMGGGGGGGSKIKLKIKACPESPSAWRGLAGQGLPQLPLHSYQVWGRLSVCPASYWGPCLALQPRPGPQARSFHRLISDQWGQGGARGRARSKGPQETDTGTKQRCRDRDAETETEEERRGHLET